MNRITTITLVRHAQADAAALDPAARPLTEEGRADARRLAETLRRDGVTALYSSDYARARDTLAPAAEALGLSLTVDPDLREWRAGALPKDRPFFDHARECWAHPDFCRGGGESFEGLTGRMRRALTRVRLACAGGHAAAASHGVAIAAVMRAFEPAFSFDDFLSLVPRAPFFYRMTFDEAGLAGAELLDPLRPLPPSDECRVEIAPTGALGAYKFVVIFARHNGRWVYCRAKTRAGWETAGGHIENGETPMDAARRELFEETGAVDFTLRPLFDYAVRSAYGWANGRLYLANVQSFGPLPPFEMAEIREMDTIPPTMRFPQILPALYDEVCGQVENGFPEIRSLTVPGFPL